MALPQVFTSNLMALPTGALAPPVGGTASPLAAGAAPPASALTFAMQQQEDNNWCWAAVAASTWVFYNSGGTTWSEQCDVASAELNLSCCPAQSNISCDVPYYLDRALQRTGNYANITVGAAALNQVTSEISSGKPLGVRIGWSQGGGHFVVISGYSTTGAVPMVTVEDPFYQQSILSYNSLLTQYQGSGSWTHSYWTQP